MNRQSGKRGAGVRHVSRLAREARVPLSSANGMGVGMSLSAANEGRYLAAPKLLRCVAKQAKKMPPVGRRAVGCP